MNKTFITGEIVENISLQYSAKNKTPYIENLKIKKDENIFSVWCFGEMAENLIKKASKDDILQIEGHLANDKYDKTKIIIVAEKIQEFRNERTDCNIMSELKTSKPEGNFNENTKALFRKMEPEQLITVMQHMGQIASVVNSIVSESMEPTNENQIIKKENEESSSLKLEPNDSKLNLTASQGNNDSTKIRKDADKL